MLMAIDDDLIDEVHETIKDCECYVSGHEFIEEATRHYIKLTRLAYEDRRRK